MRRMRLRNLLLRSFGLGAFLLGFPLAAQANPDLTVYDDSLRNGFAERMWQTLELTNTARVHSGAHSISVMPVEAWQGLYLHHPGLNTAPYKSISFWANGGILGGQRIQIQGLIGDANPARDVYYRVTLTNGWEQVSVPLEALGLAGVTNCTGFWIQITPNGTSNMFFVDDIRFDAAPEPAVVAAALPAPVDTTAAAVPATPASPASPATDDGLRGRDTAAFAIWCMAGALVFIALLLGCLLLMMRRGGMTRSRASLPMAMDPPPQIGNGSGDTLASAAARAVQSLSPVEVQSLRDRLAIDLAEFAKQSLVQGLYAQRGKLMETQQVAQAELAQLEARLTALHLPLQERIRAYECRIGDLEKQLETRDEELRNMIQATLELVRKRMESEKAKDQPSSCFN
jgi:hypothetical protein